MEKETNFTGYIEKYVVDKIERLEKENESLRKENTELKLENEQENDKPIAIPNIGVGYIIDTWDGRIKRETLLSFKNALKDKDLEWLRDEYYSIATVNWNYEIKIKDITLRLFIYYDKKRLTFTRAEYKYETYEQAENALLDVLSNDIKDKEAQFKKEDEENK